MDQATGTAEECPSRRSAVCGVVAAVALLIAVVAPATAGHVPASDDLWPFTSWELFSRLRGEMSISYRVSAVAPGERPPGEDIDLAQAGTGFNGWFQVAKQLERSSGAERLAVCRAWKVAAAGLSPVEELHVWRVITALEPTDRAATRTERSREEIVRC